MRQELVRWSFKIKGFGNDGLSATHEGVCDAHNAVEAAEIVTRKARELYWRDSAYSFAVERH